MTQQYKNLAFTTDLRYERISKKASTTFSLAVGIVQTYTIPHNLGYSPYFKIYYTYTGDNKIYEAFNGANSYYVSTGGQLDNMYADATNLYVTMENAGAVPISGTIYYRIYAEPQT